MQKYQAQQIYLNRFLVISFVNAPGGQEAKQPKIEPIDIVGDEPDRRIAVDKQHAWYKHDQK